MAPQSKNESAVARRLQVPEFAEVLRGSHRHQADGNRPLMSVAGSKSEITARHDEVRFSPETGHRLGNV